MANAWLDRALGVLDRRLYRHPFRGGAARRYATRERPAFGDLDDRLLDGLAPVLADARALVEVGAGPGTFAARAAARFGQLRVIAVEPSEYFAPAVGVETIRARGEALPIADGVIDVAMCLSSIRHVTDRLATLRELRRVVRQGGRAVIVELDPAASPQRIATHAGALGSAVLRRAFGPLVVRTAPPAAAIAALAERAGWTVRGCTVDTLQPVYVMELA